MPSLCSFDPRLVSSQWMNKKEHRTRNTTKAVEQELPGKVSHQNDSPQNEEAEEKVKSKSIKQKYSQKRIFSVNVLSKCLKYDFQIQIVNSFVDACCRHVEFNLPKNWQLGWIKNP